MSEFFDTPLSDVIALQNDKKAQLKTFEYQSSGVLPIIDQSSKFICGYTDDFSKKYSKSLPVIVFGDHTLHTKYIDFDFAVGADGTQIIRTQDPQHEHKYLYYVISREIQIMGSEGYKRHLKILKERVVPFTNSIPEQKKIASILTSVDEVIENTSRQIDKLQDLKKATMNELLTKGIGHTEFKDSELGRIPESWEVINLGSISQVVDSMHQTPTFSDHGKAMVRVTEIRNGDFIDISSAVNVNEETYKAFTKNYKPRFGDILIARVGAYFGATTYVDKEVTFCLGQNTAAIRPKDIESDFLFFFINSECVSNQMNDVVSVGAQPSLSLEVIKKIKVVCPPDSEQKLIAKSIFSITSKIINTNLKLSQTQSLKKSLMQDLLTGKVRVTVN